MVSEAIWKSTPVVAGAAGGIPLQMANGVGGILINNLDECATAVRRLLQDSNYAHQLARAGKERVRQDFLLPRLLLDELQLMRKFAGRYELSA